MTMTGDDMARIREGLGLTRVQLGNAIGYNGNWNTVNELIKDYENSKRDIPNWIATTVRALDHDGLLMFIRSYRGKDDQAEFVRQLTRHLTTGAPAQ